MSWVDQCRAADLDVFANEAGPVAASVGGIEGGVGGEEFKGGSAGLGSAGVCVVGVEVEAVADG